MLGGGPDIAAVGAGGGAPIWGVCAIFDGACRPGAGGGAAAGASVVAECADMIACCAPGLSPLSSSRMGLVLAMCRLASSRNRRLENLQVRIIRVSLICYAKRLIA